MSISSSHGVLGSFAYDVGSKMTWQVLQAQVPSHAASMSMRATSRITSINVSPTGASTVRILCSTRLSMCTFTLPGVEGEAAAEEEAGGAGVVEQ